MSRMRAVSGPKGSPSAIPSFYSTGGARKPFLLDMCFSRSKNKDKLSINAKQLTDKERDEQ